MEVHEKLGELAALVSGARSVPLSSSVMVDREQVLRLVAEVRRLLPAEVQQAGDVLAQRDEVLAAAREQAEHELVRAREQAEQLVDSQTVTRAARERADSIITTAREEAARLRTDADAWCDGKLGDFEEELERLQQQARRGRERLKTPKPAAEARAGEAAAPTTTVPQGAVGEGSAPAARP
ncbi:hypothetical protein ACFFKU_09150 [Kineococcus gynurae]|uniref:ATPase n=1 Tax=Kineococcus gynurae TaxID=452979 RepID=A0ABV5LVN5_9ACTN